MIDLADHSSNGTRGWAKERQLALRPLGLCRGDRRVGGYPRDGFLSFFHGPTHIGHQSLEIVLCSLELCSLRLHSVSPFTLEGNGPVTSIWANGLKPTRIGFSGRRAAFCSLRAGGMPSRCPCFSALPSRLGALANHLALPDQWTPIGWQSAAIVTVLVSFVV